MDLLYKAMPDAISALVRGDIGMAERFMSKTALENITASNRRDVVVWEERMHLLAEHMEYCKSIRHSIW